MTEPKRLRYIIFFSVLIVLSIFPYQLQAAQVNQSELPVIERDGREFYVYEVGKDESIYGIAKKFDWNPNVLINENRETFSSLKKGIKLYYPTGIISPATLNGDNIDNRDVITHEVKKGENIYTISRLYGISTENLYKMNPNIRKGLKTGDLIVISQNSSRNISSGDAGENQLQKNEISEEKSIVKGGEEDSGTSSLLSLINYPKNDKEEKPFSDTSQSEEELNNDILLSEDTISLSASSEIPVMNIAIVLDDPNSKKDIDFTRGVLLALDKLSKLPYKIDLNVMDGRVATNNLLDEIENYEPALIIATADKAFPSFLADYGNTHNVPVINVFDLKNDLYEDNTSIVQMLPPSPLFNSMAAHNLYNSYRHHTLMMLGGEDENDAIAQQLIPLFEEQLIAMNLEDFANNEPDLFTSYLIYSYATRKEDVADFLLSIENLQENYPGVVFRIVGRPNWVTFLDDFGDKFEEYKVIIPSKIWLDEKNPKWETFSNDYEEMFGGIPVRSIPNYAASGFDTINFFVSQMIKNADPKSYDPLQFNMNLRRMDGWDGIVNEIGYLLLFNPEEGMTVQILR